MQNAQRGFGGTTSVSSVNQPEREERTGRSPSLQKTRRIRNDSQMRPSGGGRGKEIVALAEYVAA